MQHHTATSLRPFGDATPKLGSRILIDPSAVVLGDVVLGDDTSVWPQAAVRGDVHAIAVGDRTSIQDCCVLHVSHAGPHNDGGYPLKVGSDVTIGHSAVLHGCTVGDRVLVGMGAIVMDGAVVQDDVVIAAGALVTPGKTLASGYLYAGSPARQMRELTEQEMDYFTYLAAHYVKLKDRHIDLLEAM